VASEPGPTGFGADGDHGQTQTAEPALATDPLAACSAGDSPAARRDLAARLAEHLNGEPRSRSELARRVGRRADDGSVRRALELLESEGRGARAGRGWIKRIG
jgi:hypothetical protein